MTDNQRAIVLLILLFAGLMIDGWDRAHEVRYDLAPVAEPVTAVAVR